MTRARDPAGEAEDTTQRQRPEIGVSAALVVAVIVAVGTVVMVGITLEVLPELSEPVAVIGLVGAGIFGAIRAVVRRRQSW